MRIGCVIGLIVLMLGGCAYWRDDAPSCDGSDKRPLNVGKWSGSMDFGCGGSK